MITQKHYPYVEKKQKICSVFMKSCLMKTSELRLNFMLIIYV